MGHLPTQVRVGGPLLMGSGQVETQPEGEAARRVSPSELLPLIASCLGPAEAPLFVSLVLTSAARGKHTCLQWPEAQAPISPSVVLFSGWFNNREPRARWLAGT